MGGTPTARRCYLELPGIRPKESQVADSVQEFFQSLESRADPAKTAGMTSSYVFDIDGAGQWRGGGRHRHGQRAGGGGGGGGPPSLPADTRARDAACAPSTTT